MICYDTVKAKINPADAGALTESTRILTVRLTGIRLASVI